MDIPWQHIATALEDRKWTPSCDKNTLRIYKSPENTSNIMTLEKTNYAIDCILDIVEQHRIDRVKFLIELQGVRFRNKP